MTVSKQQIYSIKDLENFTQIKAHTIRIWEQRYGLLAPQRTSSNIRFYGENDLKKILNIKLLYTNGYKISKIAALSEQEIIDTAKELITDSEQDTTSKWVDKTLLKILEFDVEGLRKTLKTELKKYGMVSLYMNQILPLMENLGKLWQVNSIGIAHEHFFSGILKEFFLVEINKISTPKTATKKAMFFLHDDEEHEFGLLLFYYLMKKAGYICYYYGQKTPVSEIEEIQLQISPDVIVTSFTSKISDKTVKALNKFLLNLTKGSTVIVSGNQSSKIQEHTEKNLFVVNTMEKLNHFLAQS